MPFGTITSTENTFGTVNGAVSGSVEGTLTGSVGVPGPAGAPGVGVPAGGTSGQFLQKTSDVSYETDWVTVNLAGLATESWVTAGFYPLTGNPSGFLTSAPVTSVAGKVGVVTLDNTDISGLGTLAVVNDAPSDGSQYARKNGAWDVVTTAPDFISSVSSPLAVTTGNLTVDLSAYAPLASPAFTGTPTAPTPSPGTDSTQIATTAWVKNFDYAPTNSPTLTGNPKSVTPSTGDNDTSIATTAFVKAQNYITSSALTPYLTTADAASTYFTIASAAGKANLSGATFTGDLFVSQSPDTTNIGGGVVGMSSTANSYLLTLSTGGGIPQIFFRGPTGDSTQTVAYPGPSGFLLKADNLSGLADTSTARTNLGLGTMATATAADYSTTTVANGLYYPLSSNPSSYLVAADIAGKADLASPTFTGTPTLPTGTIGVTQTAGNNTTALATTAFVTAAVPAFATTAEINSPASTTKAITPFDAVRMITNRAIFDTMASTGSFNTSGTGAEAYKATNDRLIGLGTPNVGIAGHGQHMFDTTAGSWGLLTAKRGANQYTQDWTKKIFASGTAMFYAIGDSATTARVMIGARAAFGAGNPTKQSIGWKLVGGGSNALVLVTYGYNGAALVVTETTSTFTPVLNQAFDWFIYHEPNVSTPSLSKCYLYVNDNLVATGINSPADPTVNFNYFLQGCESTGSHATRMAYWAFPTKIWWSRS
jgi:hypothetical protein